MNFIFNDNVRILCLSCNVKKGGKLVRFKQKGQKQASFLAFHKCCQGCLLRGPRYISTLYDKVCQRLAIGQLFSPGTAVSSINKTNRHDITGMLLKVALSTITPSQRVIRIYSCKSKGRTYNGQKKSAKGQAMIYKALHSQD
jgi:hypothetical protein